VVSRWPKFCDWHCTAGRLAATESRVERRLSQRRKATSMGRCQPLVSHGKRIASAIDAKGGRHLDDGGNAEGTNRNPIELPIALSIGIQFGLQLATLISRATAAAAEPVAVPIDEQSGRVLAGRKWYLRPPPTADISVCPPMADALLMFNIPRQTCLRCFGAQSCQGELVAITQGS
jgi:hypothetical protein